MATPKKKWMPKLAGYTKKELQARLTKLRKEAKALQLPAKRTDADKQAKVKDVLHDVDFGYLTASAGLREILAIFGYEVEA